MIEAALAYLAKPLIKLGLVALAIGVLFGLWQWERHDRIAAEKGEHAALAERDLAAADAQRWHAASDLRDLALKGLRDTVDRQNAAVQRLQFSLDRANQAATAAEAQTRDARAQFDQRTRQLEDEAHAHPDQVDPLGTIVRGRVDRLWD
jgi:DNA-binding helix-hairpin-helix protein with protein kinase domain